MCEETTSNKSGHCETHVCHLPEETKIIDRYLEEAPDVIRHDMSNSLTARGESNKTLVVNLFAGPSAGKSTTAAGIFFELKSKDINCELVTEFAKDLCWEKRSRTFTDQIYIFGEQYHRIHRLLGQVSCVITDSPILLTPIYDIEKRETLEELVVEEHNKMWTYNAFLKRKKAFNPEGRNQNLEECQNLDTLIFYMLSTYSIPFETFEGTPEGKNAIVTKVMMLLEKE